MSVELNLTLTDCHPGRLSTWKKHLALSSMPRPNRLRCFESQRPKKNRVCGSEVSQLQQTERGPFCAADKLRETLGVLLCCPAHVLEAAFPPKSPTMTFRMSRHFLHSVIRLNGKLRWSGCDPRATKPVPQQLFLLCLIAMLTHDGRHRQKIVVLLQNRSENKWPHHGWRSHLYLLRPTESSAALCNNNSSWQGSHFCSFLLKTRNLDYSHYAAI